MQDGCSCRGGRVKTAHAGTGPGGGCRGGCPGPGQRRGCEGTPGVGLAAAAALVLAARRLYPVAVPALVSGIILLFRVLGYGEGRSG